MNTYRNIPDVINAPRDDGDNMPSIAMTETYEKNTFTLIESADVFSDPMDTHKLLSMP